MSRQRKILSFAILVLVAISTILVVQRLVEYDEEQREIQRIANRDLIGDWREYLIQDEERKETSLRRISVDSAGNLVQTLHVELGPQCRLWVHLTDLSYEDGIVELGGEFEGPISADKNSIMLEYGHPLGETYDFVLERLNDPQTTRFLDSLESCIGTAYTYTPPDQQNGGLACGDLTTARIDTSLLFDLVQEIRSGAFGDIHSLLIARDDILAFEEYFGARGMVLGPAVNSYYRGRVHQLASATKSVVSALVGIAKATGSFASVDQRISDFFPDYKPVWTDRTKEIHIYHLLTMTAGWEWNESSLSYSRMSNDANLFWMNADPIGYVFGKPLADEPGTRFVYNSGASDVLGEIVRRATGEPIESFAEAHLLTPLGIRDSDWSVHTSGMTSASGGLSLRTRDFMKLGLLFLHEGRWAKMQVVPADWIKESTSSQISAGTNQYGYQWWIRTYSVGNEAFRCYYAMGLGGNFLSVFPDLDLVVASTGQDFESGWTGRYYSMMERYILPAVRSTDHRQRSLP